MWPLKSNTLRGVVPESSFDIAGTLQILPPTILTIFSGAGYRGHRLHQKQRHPILFSFAIRSLFEPGRGLINSKRVMYLAMLVEFASAVDAARCAVEVQRGVALENIDVPQQARIEFRIGIHVGDIIFDDNDIFGDGVNIAARLEGLAQPGGICISDDAQRQIRGKLDSPFEDMGPQNLKNITEPMRAWRLSVDAKSAEYLSAERFAGVAQPLALPDKPSIAVLPFQNMSSDPEQDYFADGMVEDIITALSRYHGLFVIARNSSFAYKGQAVDIKRVGRELGVRYVLEGSVRKIPGRVRVTGQLIDASTGTHLWADRFDGAMEDIFDLQDKVAFSVAGVIETTVQGVEIRRSEEQFLCSA